MGDTFYFHVQENAIWCNLLKNIFYDRNRTDKQGSVECDLEKYSTHEQLLYFPKGSDPDK